MLRSRLALAAVMAIVASMIGLAGAPPASASSMLPPTVAAVTGVTTAAGVSSTFTGKIWKLAVVVVNKAGEPVSEIYGRDGDRMLMTGWISGTGLPDSGVAFRAPLSLPAVSADCAVTTLDIGGIRHQQTVLSLVPLHLNSQATGNIFIGHLMCQLGTMVNGNDNVHAIAKHTDALLAYFGLGRDDPRAR